MVATGQLPIPQITARRFGARCLPALTDDALYERTGVRVAFTGRAGGVSEGPYSSLNLGNHVGDDPASSSSTTTSPCTWLGTTSGTLSLIHISEPTRPY